MAGVPRRAETGRGARALAPLPAARWRRLLQALSLLALAAATSFALAPLADAISKQALSHGVLATVKLGTLDRQERLIATCSGTVIHPAGLVLTNWHCVGLTHDAEEDDSEQGLKPGDLYHPRGLLVVAPTVDPRKPPVPTYVGQLAAGTPELDIAVLRIVGMYNRREPLPAALPLVVAAMGDSDRAEIGDPVHAVGYPGLGGPLVNVTSGIVAGFDDRNEDGELDSIKITADISSGSSGGLAMNDAGELIGIPTWATVRGAKSVDRMMMGNLARPHIEQALRAPRPPPAPSPVPGPCCGPRPTPVPTPGSDLRPKPSPPPSDGAVTLAGSIVDADTRRPVPGAILVVLRPGTSIGAWDESEGIELAAAVGVAGQDGTYRTAPPLARGAVYTAIAGARDYSRRVFENQLEIGPDEPALVEIEPIALKRR